MSRGQLGAKISLGMDPFKSFLNSLLFISKNVAAVKGLHFGFPKQYLVSLSIIGSQAEAYRNKQKALD